MYENINNPVRNEEVKGCAIEGPVETVQSIVEEIMETARRCESLGFFITENLFGPKPTSSEEGRPVSCMRDSLEVTRAILKNTLSILEGTYNKL